MIEDSDSVPQEPHSTPDPLSIPAVTRFSRDPEQAEPESPLEEETDDDWSLPDEVDESEVSAEDIQDAYLKALLVMDGIDWPVAPSAQDEPASPDNVSEPATTDSTPVLETGAPLPPAETDPVAAASAGPEPIAENVVPAPQLETVKTVRTPAPSKESTEPEPPPAVNPARVLEAILFVGGSPITCKRLCSVLGGNIDQNFVEQRIDELNSEYASQGRPYEIRLGEGGYRLALKPEFESVRNKVYGAGPREVKLSQDALEVLALVAYQQPISQTDVEASGKRSAGNLLRQLIRRELVGITRIDSTRSGIRYQTTPRFLSLFGLASIDELPKADELSMR